MIQTLKAHKARLLDQLRAQGIRDEAVLSALEATPRELFIPPLFHDQAYEDRALPIGRGQTISQPYVVARMTETLDLNDRLKVLEVGTGSGYQASILARLCRRVYTIERHRALLENAEHLFEQQRLRNITAIVGDGMKGWPAQAPFDRIIVTAASEKAPQALLDQLAIGGIMIIPIGAPGQPQNLRRYKREADDIYSAMDILPVRFVPLLPEIAQDLEPDSEGLDVNEEEGGEPCPRTVLA